MEILRDPFFLLRAGHADEKDVRVDALKHFQDAQILIFVQLIADRRTVGPDNRIS